MCIHTRTQQRRKILPPQTPPDWTPGCSLKLKYSIGIAHNTNNDKYCDELSFKRGVSYLMWCLLVSLKHRQATVSYWLALSDCQWGIVLWPQKWTSLCWLFFLCNSPSFIQQSQMPVCRPVCLKIRMSSFYICWASTQMGMHTDQCHSKTDANIGGYLFTLLKLIANSLLN